MSAGSNPLLLEEDPAAFVPDDGNRQARKKKPKKECFFCGKSGRSLLLCKHCGLVYSCSEDHFRCHRRKDYCFPFRVSWTGAARRDLRQTGAPAVASALIACRDIQPLELVLYDLPVATGPGDRACSSDSSSPCCVQCCVRTSGLRRCGLCQLPVCSDTCQVGPDHYDECRVLRGCRDRLLLAETAGGVHGSKDRFLNAAAVLPLRLFLGAPWSDLQRLRFVCGLPSCGGSEGSPDDGGPHSGPWALERSRLARFILEAMEQRHQQEVAAACPPRTGRTRKNREQTLKLDPEEVERILDFVRSRSVPLPGTGEGWAAVAFHPNFALIRHRCGANSKFSVFLKDKGVAVQAKAFIAAGQEITVSLAHDLEPTWKRRARLYRDHLLLCRCSRCSDPTELGSNLSALGCPKCGGGGGGAGGGAILPQNPLDFNSVWSCRVHRGIRMSARSAQRLQLDLQADLYKAGTTTTIPRLQRQISGYSDLLHPNHGLVMAAKRSLIHCFGQVPAHSVTRQMLATIRGLCQEQLQVLAEVDPGYPDWKGDVLKHLSTANLNLARLDLEEARIQRPEFLARVKEAMLMVKEAVRCQSSSGMRVQDGRSRMMSGPGAEDDEGEGQSSSSSSAWLDDFLSDSANCMSDTCSTDGSFF